MLDYWFRAHVSGAYNIKISIEWKTGALGGSCSVKVIDGSPEEILKGVEQQIDTYHTLRAALGKVRTEAQAGEYWSFYLAFVIYFTYLGEASNTGWPRLRGELRRRHEGDRSGWLEMLDNATADGPGGIRILD